MQRSTRTLVLTASALFLWSCGKDANKAASAGDSAKPAAVQPAVAPGGRPARKPGLWEHAVSTMGMTQSSTLCIDAATDKNVELWGRSAQADSGCSKNAFTPIAGGYAFESVCPAGPEGGTVTTKGAITGDFSSAYKMEATVATAGSAMPQANQTMNMTMTATWKGPCPPDMKPGDVKVAIAGLPGGAQLNVGDMAKMAEGKR
ncbi:MAG: DUF3617 family protein [Phenylobacterium sp.]